MVLPRRKLEETRGKENSRPSVYVNGQAVSKFIHHEPFIYLRVSLCAFWFLVSGWRISPS